MTFRILSLSGFGNWGAGDWGLEIRIRVKIIFLFMYNGQHGGLIEITLLTVAYVTFGIWLSQCE